MRRWRRLRTVIFILLCFMIWGCGNRTTEPNMDVPQQLNQAKERNIPIVDNHKGQSLERQPKHQPEIKSEKPNVSIHPNHSNQKHQQTNENRKKVKVKAKGIYVSGWIAGSRKRMKPLIKLVDETELNSMVIDMKNDSGEITFDSKVPYANEIKSDRRKMISDIQGIMNELQNKEIYTIARIVAFKDPYLAGKRPKLAMHYKSGSVWKDAKGISWVDPYQKEVRDYNIELAKEAALLGFDEIQFDYVRFPDNGAKVDKEVLFSQTGGLSKSELIAKFLNEAKKQLEPYGVYVSADVFGLTTSVKDDMGIGQDWNLISQEVDYISPMVYPSHYSQGMYGISNPDLEPYLVVNKAMKDAVMKNQVLKETKETAVIRPWLQAFTASWVHPHLRYTDAQIKVQIKAAKEQGVDEYLLWNPLCKYSFQ
jgi:hypothetical protein